jgi:hypothetical protein
MKKIRHRFFKADKWEIVKRVSVSAITQHHEVAISATSIHLVNQNRFCCQDLIFYTENTSILHYRQNVSVIKVTSIADNIDTLKLRVPENFANRI